MDESYGRFTRVFRTRGRAVRHSVPAGPLADFLHVQAEYDEARRAALSEALRALHDRLDPAFSAAGAYHAAIDTLFAQFMNSVGYRRAKDGWRKKHMSVELFTKLDGAAAHPARDLDRATDLGRTAHDAWVGLLAGGDAVRRAAVAAEIAERRAGWALPDDPPAIALLADGLATAWVQQAFYALECGRGAAAGLPDDQRAVLSARLAAADARVAALARDLTFARHAAVEWRARLLRLDDLRRKADNRKRKASKQARGSRT